jgi:hypothetical protein
LNSSILERCLSVLSQKSELLAQIGNRLESHEIIRFYDFGYPMIMVPKHYVMASKNYVSFSKYYAMNKLCFKKLYVMITRNLRFFWATLIFRKKGS